MSELKPIEEIDLSGPLVRKTRWGKWELKEGDGLEPAIEYSERPHYYIPLNECKTTIQMQYWLFHMSWKRWVSDADLGNLVRALRDTGGWGIVEKDMNTLGL